jgi:hypothetical protein
MELGETKSLAIAVVDIGAVKGYVSEPLNPQRTPLLSSPPFFSLINTHHFRDYMMFPASRCLSWLADANDFNLCRFRHLRGDHPSWT